MQDIYSLPIIIENTEIMLFRNKQNIFTNEKWSGNMHFHSMHEMFIVLDGKLRLESDYGVLTLDRQDVCITPPRCVHRTTNLYENPSNLISMYFAYRRLKTKTAFDFFSVINSLSARDMRPTRLRIDKLMMDNLCAILADDADENGRLSPINEAKIKSIFSLIFLNIAEKLPSVNEAAEDLYTKNTEYYARLSMIESCLSRSFSSEELSKYLFMSARQVSNIFRSEYGMSIKQYKYAMQMRDAANMLIDSPKQSIRSIAEIAGYASPEIFSILFKRYFGVSPSEYRKQNTPE